MFVECFEKTAMKGVFRLPGGSSKLFKTPKPIKAPKIQSVQPTRNLQNNKIIQQSLNPNNRPRATRTGKSFGDQGAGGKVNQ